MIQVESVETPDGMRFEIVNRKNPKAPEVVFWSNEIWQCHAFIMGVCHGKAGKA